MRQKIDNQYKHLKREFEVLCINHNNFTTKSSNLEISCDQFNMSNSYFKSGLEVGIENVDSFQEGIYQTREHLSQISSLPSYL